MSRRAIIATEPPSPYKYQGDKDANIRPHEQCEMSEPGGKHTVQPKSWPPVRKGRQMDDPYLELKCIYCGVNLQVYRKHATGELDGVTVILPDKPAALAAEAPTPKRRGRRPRKRVEGTEQVA